MRAFLNEVGIKDYRKMKPTKKHTAVVWEGMLGTVYAKKDGKVKNFDYDWKGAAEYVGLENAEDIRIGKYDRNDPYNDNTPRKNQTCVWIQKTQKKRVLKNESIFRRSWNQGL